MTHPGFVPADATASPSSLVASTSVMLRYSSKSAAATSSPWIRRGLGAGPDTVSRPAAAISALEEPAMISYSPGSTVIRCAATSQ